MKPWIKYILAITVFMTFMWGIGEPVVVLWAESTMVGVVKEFRAPDYNMTVALKDFEAISVGSMWLCVQSIILVAVGTACLTYLLIDWRRSIGV